MNDSDFVSTGIPGLDDILDGLRIGDNVVWRLHDIEDYQQLVQPFVKAAQQNQRRIIYLRFAKHPAVIDDQPQVQRVDIDALSGFESFTSHVWQLIQQHGPGAFYVCDSLSDLLNAWATDHMVGHFFRVICPLLYQLDTVAYFALHSGAHSDITLSRIRQTTQVMIDLHRAGNDTQIQPIKVWKRYSPTMFLPHHQRHGQFIPVTDSTDAARLQALIEQDSLQHRSERALDYWDRLFISAAEQCAVDCDDPAVADTKQQIIQVMLSRDPRMRALLNNYFSLGDLIAIRERLIGSGYIGGKALGMLLARQMLLSTDAEYWLGRLDPHDSFYIGSDLFYAFLVHNQCWSSLMQQRSDQGYYSEAPILAEQILSGCMPEEIVLELQALLDHFGQYPILIRSSSLQEDSFGAAFAGKYDSIFLSNQGSPEQRLAALVSAIKQIYASTMNQDALRYRERRGLACVEEPMALLVQRVNGRYHGNYYLPDAAAVGVSRNCFIWHPDMQPRAGMLRLVMGLGTRAVDRIQSDHACVVALDQPMLRPYRSQQEQYQFCQQLVDLIDVHQQQGVQTLSLRKLLQELDNRLPIQQLAVQDHVASRRASELGDSSAIWRLTFEPLLKDTDFVALTQTMLATLEACYDQPVDIEFTVNLSGAVPHINLVQCRPMSIDDAAHPAGLPTDISADSILFENNGQFMGSGPPLQLDYLLYVPAEQFAQLTHSQRFTLAKRIGAVCNALPPDACIMLIGPGRWGTSSPELGIPVRYADINRVAVLVEVADLGNGLIPDLSFGSHFFQDLVESGTRYAALFPNDADCLFQPHWLDKQPAIDLGSLLEAETTLPDCLQVYALIGQQVFVISDIVAQKITCLQK